MESDLVTRETIAGIWQKARSKRSWGVMSRNRFYGAIFTAVAILVCPHLFDSAMASSVLKAGSVWQGSSCDYGNGLGDRAASFCYDDTIELRTMPDGSYWLYTYRKDQVDPTKMILEFTEWDKFDDQLLQRFVDISTICQQYEACNFDVGEMGPLATSSGCIGELMTADIAGAFVFNGSVLPIWELGSLLMCVTDQDIEVLIDRAMLPSFQKGLGTARHPNPLDTIRYLHLVPTQQD